MRQLLRILSGLVTASCLLFLLTSLSVRNAMADPINVTFSFTGTVTSVGPALAGFFPNGQSLTGSFSFDPTIAPRPGGNTFQEVFDAVTALNFDLAGFTGAFSGGPGPEIQIDNDLAGFSDRFLVLSRAGDGLAGSSSLNGFTLLSFALRLDDLQFTAFDTAQTLPTSLTLLDFENRQFFVDFIDSSGNLQHVSGTINSLTATAVPEPAVIWMLGVGVAPLLFLKRLVPGLCSF